MLKRIKVKDVKLGMHIHEVNGAWMGKPDWRVSCLIDKPEDLKKLQSSSLSEIWIDTDKGIDMDGSDAAQPQLYATIATPKPAPIPATPSVIAELPQPVAPIVPEPPQPEPTRELAPEPVAPHPPEAKTPAPPKVNIAQEAARAVKICAHAKGAVTSMFHEARMGKALSGNDALEVVEEISSSVLRNPGAIISLARLKDKDDYTYMHSVAVCALMVALARQLNLNTEEIRQAGLAGLVHDIGKMMMPMDVLNKPGKLTNEEFDIIKGHPEAGHKLLLDGENINRIALDVCLHHHEKTNGSGYPKGLKGDEISLYAKMGAVCDVYDAITSNRPYKSGWEPSESLRKMAEWGDGHFDKVVFDAFVKSIGIYPIGSLVRLQSQRLAVVIEQSPQSLLTPIVKVFFSIKSDYRIPPELLDLSKPYCRDKILTHESPEKWGIKDIQELWSGIPA
ncbi:MAG: HD-GYP domain-containing protein [Gallionella sp.]|nr:HD-GYP domain-containing protein [Gallionella sp.]